MRILFLYKSNNFYLFAQVLLAKKQGNRIKIVII